MYSQSGSSELFERRRFLQVACVAVGGGLAGCLGGSDDEQTDDEQTDDGQTDDEPTSNPTLRDTLAWESSYAMELAVPLGAGTIIVHDGDTYTAWTVNGMEMEVYRIGTDTYIVVEGECFIPIDSTEDDIFDPEDLTAEFGDVTATETATIDGREVYRFDVDEGYLYVSRDSGYPVRFEHDDDSGVIDFHSWGETEPISPPDMECVEQ